MVVVSWSFTDLDAQIEALCDFEVCVGVVSIDAHLNIVVFLVVAVSVLEDIKGHSLIFFATQEILEIGKLFAFLKRYRVGIVFTADALDEILGIVADP